MTTSTAVLVNHHPALPSPAPLGFVSHSLQLWDDLLLKVRNKDHQCLGDQMQSCGLGE